MTDETRAVRTWKPRTQRPRADCRDEDNARKGYEQLLQRWGYEVLGVASAEERWRNFPIPTGYGDRRRGIAGMNGLDLLKQLGDELKDVRRSSLPEREARSAR